MKTTRPTKWSIGNGEYETVPAGTEVRIIDWNQLDSVAGKTEGPAVRACASRMRERGQQVVFGVLGNVRCFTKQDFQ